MNLSPQNAALLSILNSTRIALTQEVKKEVISPENIMKQLLTVETYALDASDQIPDIEHETMNNIAKLLSSTFIDSNHGGHKYKVSASVFTDFLKQVQPATAKEQPQTKQIQPVPVTMSVTMPVTMPTTNQPITNTGGIISGRPYYDGKVKYVKFGRQEKKMEEEKPKQAQFVSALGLVSTTNQPNPPQSASNAQNQLQSKYPTVPSVRKKFVPPFKKAESQKDSQNKLNIQDIEDPRLKNLEPRMVQMILSEVLDSQKPIKWSDIAGLSFAKKTIYEMIVWPMLRPDIFTGLRSPPKGILLFGPPGTGKTLIGKAIASESNSTFFSISASSLTSKWVGESQKMVRTLFMVAKVKQPSVIFIDEIDSLLCARSEKDDDSTRRIKTEFLVQLDGAKSLNDQRVLIIGATNRPEELDDAVKRRFVKRLYIPLPNKQGRRELFTNTSQNSAFSLSEADIEQITNITRGYSGADLHNLCTEASMIPLRRLDTKISEISFDSVPPTTLADLKDALKLVRPTVSKSQLEGYMQWNKNYGSYQFSNNEELDN